MTFMYAQRDDSVSSQGRNGTAQTHGINISVYAREERIPKIMLTPITSRGNWQNCSIDIPLADFWRMIEWMEQEGLR